MANIGRIFKDSSTLNRPAKHLPKNPQGPANKRVLTAMVNTDPRIDVRIFKRKALTEVNQGYHYAKFTLYSHVQPNFAVEGVLELDRKSMSDLDFESGVLCGSMSERINEVYGDNFTPDLVARYGASQLTCLIEAWGKETSLNVSSSHSI